MKWWHVVLIIVAFQLAETLLFGTIGAVALAARDKTSSVLP